MKKLVSTPGLEMVCLWGCGCLAFVLPECRAQGAKACLGLGTTLLGSTYLVLYGLQFLQPPGGAARWPVVHMQEFWELGYSCATGHQLLPAQIVGCVPVNGLCLELQWFFNSWIV